MNPKNNNPLFSDLIPELINEVALDFKNHLAIEKNERIVFSGKFGKGKTTFITEFFKNQEKHIGEDKYNVVFLDPVNYTVSSNEDILKYIKYDILLHLLIEQKVELEPANFTFKETAAYYLANHPKEAIKGFIKYIPKVGMLLNEAIPGIEKLNENIELFKTNIENVSEESKAISFLDMVEKESYSIYENDVITELIRRILNPDIKSKENVLVIDNLDRIDPEHIFRILNIFSTQMEYRQYGVTINKFYFDKVVVVCDIQNIRNIYRNKYGADVDFSGYIDKFYSVEIFYFQNYEQLRKTSHKILRELQIRMDSGGRIVISESRNDFGIFYLITTLVLQNQISLRQLLNFCSVQMLLADIEIPANNDMYKPVYETPLVQMLVLSKLLGGYHELLKTLKFLSRSNAPINNYVHHFKRMVHFQLRHDFPWNAESIIWKWKGKEMRVNINGTFHELNSMEIREIQSGMSLEFKPSHRDFYDLYIEILQEFHLAKRIE